MVASRIREKTLYPVGSKSSEMTSGVGDGGGGGAAAAIFFSEKGVFAELNFRWNGISVVALPLDCFIKVLKKKYYIL